jgi:hypothetical protein
MDAARLQTKVYSGYGKSAQRTGYAFTVYRPASGSAPIVSGNVVGSPINAAFTPRSSGGSGGFNFTTTNDYTKPLFHGLFDATNIHVGDYLTAAGHGAYFVIAKPDLAPSLCVQCNNMVSVLRAQEASGAGAQSYIGATSGNEASIMASFPASVIYEARGKNSGAALPMDDVNPYFVILLPAVAGIDVRATDIITDNNSPVRRYTVSSSELSPFGWRIVARLATT